MQITVSPVHQLRIVNVRKIFLLPLHGTVTSSAKVIVILHEFGFVGSRFKSPASITPLPLTSSTGQPLYPAAVKPAGDKSAGAAGIPQAATAPSQLNVNSAIGQRMSALTALRT